MNASDDRDKASADAERKNVAPDRRKVASFKEYPPSQRAQSFSIDQIVEKMQRSLEATQSR
jgi:hypothetical protein